MSQRPPKKLALAIDADLVQDNMPAEVVPKVYIGSIHAAFNQETLAEKGITHILNASRLPSTFPKMFNYLSIDVRDKDDANILSCIPAANIFIEAGVDSGGVLVHCYGGRSRSAALIAAFLLSSTGWDLEHVVKVIHAARPVTAINAGFEKQLRAYAQTKYDVYLAQQVLLRGRVRALAEYRRVVEQHAQRDANNKAMSVSTGAREAKESGRPPRQDLQDKAIGPAPPVDDMSGHKRCWSAGSSASKDSAMDESRDGTPREFDDIIVDNSSSPLSPGYMGEGSVGTPRGPNYTLLARMAATNMVAGVTQEISDSRSRKVKAVPVTPSGQSSSGGFGSRGKSGSGGGKIRRHIPLVDSKPPHIRLSRPGSASVRVIPPLRGLEKSYICSWCGCTLFNLGNVLRLDVDVPPLCMPHTDRELAESKSPTSEDAGSLHGRSSEDDNKFPAPSGYIRPPNNRAISEFSVPAGSPRWHPNGGSNDNGDAKESAGFGFGFAPPMSTRNKGKDPSFDFDFKSDSVGGFGHSENFPAPSVRGKYKGFGFDSIPDNPDLVEAAMSVDQDELSPGGNWGKGSDSALRPDIVPSLMGHDVGVGIKLGLINDVVDMDSKESTLSPTTPRSTVRVSPPANNHPPVFRQNSATRLSGASATAAAQVEFSFDSPRIAVPPNRVIGPGDTSWSPILGRPQSAEKKRWLARANLLREGDSKVAKMAQEDDEASQLLFGKEKYIYLEYLEWMGEDMFKPNVNECEIKCGQCQRAIGGCCWTPQPNQTFCGRLEAPLIKVHKSVVQEVRDI